VGVVVGCFAARRWYPVEDFAGATNRQGAARCQTNQGRKGDSKERAAEKRLSRTRKLKRKGKEKIEIEIQRKKKTIKIRIERKKKKVKVKIQIKITEKVAIKRVGLEGNVWRERVVVIEIGKICLIVSSYDGRLVFACCACESSEC
jgi:hypothetical protein